MLRIIDDVEEAKRGLLRRLPLEAQEVPAAVKEKIREVFKEDLTPQQVVDRIVADVRSRGDAAILDYNRRLDGVESADLEVKPEEVAQAYSQVSPELVSALNLAAERIRMFHSRRQRRSWIEVDDGGLGERIQPLDRVGVYVPGGSASYPSTVLMACIPARIAGVPEIIVTVPSRGGVVPPATLVAADIASVDRVLHVGGAQAIAALAFGTESVPRVDKVCGPGNIFVQLAKKMVYGVVDIDGLYGPTELAIVADESANPAICAADLLAQAEHDFLAVPILLTTSKDLAMQVQRETEVQLARLERRETIAFSLENMGGIVVVADLEEAVDLVNYYAPEHLSVMVRDAWAFVGLVRHAGAVFVGENSPQAAGDYVAGPSHVLPTGGSARYGSALTADDFLKVTSLVAMDSTTLGKVAPAAATIARWEGLDGHARALEIRLAAVPDDDCED